MTKEEKRERRLAQKREYYQRNRETILAKQKEYVTRPEVREKTNNYWWDYTTANFEKRLLSAIKYKCKKNNIPFDLTEEDLKIPTHCPVTGIELKIRSEKGKKDYFTPSVDRIDPKGGYVKGNIRIVCLWYNTAKLMFSDAEVYELCKKVVENGALSLS